LSDYSRELLPFYDRTIKVLQNKQPGEERDSRLRMIRKQFFYPMAIKNSAMRGGKMPVAQKIAKGHFLPLMKSTFFRKIVN